MRGHGLRDDPSVRRRALSLSLLRDMQRPRPIDQGRLSRIHRPTGPSEEDEEDASTPDPSSDVDRRMMRHSTPEVYGHFLIHGMFAVLP